MAVILLLADMFLHKGIIRVLLPKEFPPYEITNQAPPPNIKLINTNKQWIKAIDTKDLMNTVSPDASGIETDIYFDSTRHYFDVHHDEDNSTGLNFDDLLQVYQTRNLTSSIWMDFKNLSAANQLSALAEVTRLRKKYGLQNKIIVESGYPLLLTPYADSGFFTSYYVPYFNPYLISKDSLISYVNVINNTLEHATVQSLSGYYYQASFLHHYFPNYPILIWGSNDRFSLVNSFYKEYVKGKDYIFIALYPKQ